MVDFKEKLFESVAYCLKTMVDGHASKAVMIIELPEYGEFELTVSRPKKITPKKQGKKFL